MKRPEIMPRLGPATNLRPAGAHKVKVRHNRARVKALLKKEVRDGME